MKFQRSLFHLMCSNACEISRSITNTETDTYGNHALECCVVKQMKASEKLSEM